MLPFPADVPCVRGDIVSGDVDSLSYAELCSNRPNFYPSLTSVLWYCLQLFLSDNFGAMLTKTLPPSISSILLNMLDRT